MNVKSVLNGSTASSAKGRDVGMPKPGSIPPVAVGRPVDGFQTLSRRGDGGIPNSATPSGLNGKRYPNLKKRVAETLLRKLANHLFDPRTSTMIETMALSAGFQLLNVKEQTRLINLVGSTYPDFSRPAGEAMDVLLHDASFFESTGIQQHQRLLDFLAEELFLPKVVEARGNLFDSRRHTYTLTGPVDLKDHAFRGGPADALKYELEIEGTRIPVYVCASRDQRFEYTTIEEVAISLSALQQFSRKLVTQVNVEAKKNADDAYWAKKYNTPEFTSFMTADATGTITIYPLNMGARAPQAYIDGTMIHEAGHTLSRRAWGNNNDKRWGRWERACSNDGVHASTYAKSSPSEDFSETLQLHQMVEGTPYEAEIRELMPRRFRIIDDLLSQAG